MNYIDDIFQRANLQQIRSFLRIGVESEIVQGDYRQRLEEASKSVIDDLHKYIENKEEREEMGNKVLHALDVSEDVYLEVGIQIGCKLMMEYVSNFK